MVRTSPPTSSSYRVRGVGHAILIVAAAVIALSTVPLFADTDGRLLFDGGHVITMRDDFTDEYYTAIGIGTLDLDEGEVLFMDVGAERLIYRIGDGATLKVVIPEEIEEAVAFFRRQVALHAN